MTLPSMNGKRWIVFFDFDNTITPFDVLDEIIKRFSIDDGWKKLEQAWEKGKIGSKECLEGQLRSIRVTREVLARFLSTVPLDPSFKKLLGLLKRKGMESAIVSDSFSFIIKEILQHNGIRKREVYANTIRFNGGRLIPSFPYWNGDCIRCAHCKKKHVLENADKTTVYVGDGLSDICPAERADLVFAKANLLTYLNQHKKPCLDFKDLGDVYAFFEQLEPAEPVHTVSQAIFTLGI